MRIVGIIPARYASQRLPGKALAELAGEPMVWHVYQRARQASCLQRVLVATDDERICEAVIQRGGEAVMTSPEHLSGTDRIAEVARRLDCHLVVNIQGDEPTLDPAIIEAAVEPFYHEPDLRMGTAAAPIRTVEEFLSTSTAKVVLDERGYALYFSRAPLPHFRLDTPPEATDNIFVDSATGLTALKHIGLYVYRRETLLWLTTLQPTALEQAEKLEQLRALGHGCPIRVVQVEYSPCSVDTAEDLEAARRLLGS